MDSPVFQAVVRDNSCGLSQQGRCLTGCVFPDQSVLGQCPFLQKELKGKIEKMVGRLPDTEPMWYITVLKQQKATGKRKRRGRKRVRRQHLVIHSSQVYDVQRSSAGREFIHARCPVSRRQVAEDQVSSEREECNAHGSGLADEPVLESGNEHQVPAEESRPIPEQEQPLGDCEDCTAIGGMEEVRTDEDISHVLNGRPGLKQVSVYLVSF